MPVFSLLRACGDELSISTLHRETLYFGVDCYSCAFNAVRGVNVSLREGTNGTIQYLQYNTLRPGLPWVAGCFFFLRVVLFTLLWISHCLSFALNKFGWRLTYTGTHVLASCAFFSYCLLLFYIYCQQQSPRRHALPASIAI